MCKSKNYMVWMPPFIYFLLNNCLLPPFAELLRWELGVVFQETAVLGGSCIMIYLGKNKLTSNFFLPYNPSSAGAGQTGAPGQRLGSV